MPTQHLQLLPASGSQLKLSPSDLIAFEAVLRENIRNFIPFSSFNLYFPANSPSEHARDSHTPVLEGTSLLLPFIQQATKSDSNPVLLAMARLTGIDSDHCRKIISLCPAIINSCLEIIRLRKLSICDPHTGLFNRHYLQNLLERELSKILDCILPGKSTAADCPVPSSHKAAFGVMILDIDRMLNVNERYGHLFGDRIIASLAKTITETVPTDCRVSRLGGDSFAIFWSQAALIRCAKLAEEIRKAISEKIFTYELSGEQIALTCSIGHAAYPQDLRGPQFQLSVAEQARVILEKAEKAVVTAKQKGRNQFCSFGTILTEGGCILEILPLNRVLINLGQNVDAQEGQRFQIWSNSYDGQRHVLEEHGQRVMGNYPAMVKGELVIQEVQDEISIAEILFLNDPAWNVVPGDRLTLQEDSFESLEELISENCQTPRDPLTGLYSYRAFLGKWARVRKNNDKFSLIMIRIVPRPKNDSQLGPQLENKIRQIVFTAEAALGGESFGGRFSQLCLIFYTPQKQSTLEKTCSDIISDSSQSADINLILGCAGFPFLHYSNSEVLGNLLKTMDHAALLTDPRIAFFNSVTLNISADKLFTKGEFFAALEEYQCALSANPNNSVARNSLGICFARLGKYNKARQQFREIAKREPGNVMAWYNYGFTSLKLQDATSAEEAFRECLKLSPTHVFSMFRLGKLAEQRKDFAQAVSFYSRASKIDLGRAAALRHLGRLAWSRSEFEKAGEHLHQALVTDPKDAFALNLLARLYMETDNNLEIAETFARQSAHIMPENLRFWADLADLLETQGKHDEARQARVRAGENF